MAPGLQFRVAPADAGEADHRSTEHHQGARPGVVAPVVSDTLSTPRYSPLCTNVPSTSILVSNRCLHWFHAGSHTASRRAGSNQNSSLRRSLRHDAWRSRESHHRSARRKRRSSGEKATMRRVKKPQFDLQRASTTDRRSRSGVGRSQLARALQGRWVRAQNAPSPKRTQGRPSMLRVNCSQRAALAMFFRFEKIEPVLLSFSFRGG